MPGQSRKGNPAHHRMSNAALKTRRASSWGRGRARKQKHVKAQNDRENANALRRIRGEPLAWEVACAERAARREAAGVRAAWLKRQAGS